VPVRIIQLGILRLSSLLLISTESTVAERQFGKWYHQDMVRTQNTFN